MRIAETYGHQPAIPTGEPTHSPGARDYEADQQSAEEVFNREAATNRQGGEARMTANGDAPDRNRTSARGLGNRCSIH
jgi:hypothetical protein